MSILSSYLVHQLLPTLRLNDDLSKSAVLVPLSLSLGARAPYEWARPTLSCAVYSLSSALGEATNARRLVQLSLCDKPQRLVGLRNNTGPFAAKFNTASVHAVLARLKTASENVMTKNQWWDSRNANGLSLNYMD